MENICDKLGYDSCLAVDVEGRSVGLVVFWKDISNCRVLITLENSLILSWRIEKLVIGD